jgi:hypothetical protein
MPRVILMSIHGSTTQTKTHWDRSQYLNCTYHQ